MYIIRLIPMHGQLFSLSTKVAFVRLYDFSFSIVTMTRLFLAVMVLKAISFAPPTCPNWSPTDVDLAFFLNITDVYWDTCDVIPVVDISSTGLLWRFPAHTSGVNRFRLVSSGTQTCSDINTVWFVSDKAIKNLSECRVTQNTTGQFTECLITCGYACGDCEYLHFRVQMPPWMRRTLAICHFELLNEYDTVHLPFVIIWDCEYLHFWVEMPVWVRQTLAISHFELLNIHDMVKLPFVVYYYRK